jgi:Ca2+-binding RTX toxin-like protein
MRRAVVLAAFVVLLLAGSSEAGSYFPPPGDCCPQWSPHGTQLVFTDNRGQGNVVGVVSLSGGPEHFVPGIPIGVRSPDWTHVAYTKDVGWLAASAVDGSGEHLLGKGGHDPAWSPDSSRIAFVASDGSLDVIRADGTGLVTVASHASGPSWSADGKQLAYVTGTHIRVVASDGSGPMIEVTPGNASPVSDPVWAPTGDRIAFWIGAGMTTAKLAVTRLGGPTKLYAIAGPNSGWPPTWRGSTVYADAAGGMVGIDVVTGKQSQLKGVRLGVFSPQGTQVAWPAGGECRDRVGIYVASANGSNQRRVTNSCRVVGTAGPDVLHGSFSQVVLGLGGNDTLYADDTYYFFDGDSLYGGPGNDRLIGGSGQDILNGGPGDDVISGGGSADIITGGPGHDTIDGGGGGDTIYARDGQRDVINCGPNGYGKAGRDTVYADRIDVVSNCEIVHRS